MKDLVVRGAIYNDGEMVRGTYSVLKERFVDPKSKADVEGTLVRAPINFHTHLGDSFIGAEPEGDIGQIVGPEGFKARALRGASAASVRRYMKRAVEYMKGKGTAAFFDFRESGVPGLDLAPKFSGISGFFLTRPVTRRDAGPLLNRSAGFGMSSLSDHEFAELMKLSELAHSRKKIFSIHFSENGRESVRSLIALRPDYVVHCIEASDDDLDALRVNGIPVSITPRSNIFHGKRPDYSRFFVRGLNVLLGTDNAFISEPGIMEEAEFLYRYQRKLNRLSPEQVLSTVIDNPRSTISKLGLKLASEKYLVFPNEFLTPYQLVTRPNFYDRLIVSRNVNGITFFARKD